MLLLVAVNLVSIYGAVITGRPAPRASATPLPSVSRLVRSPLRSCSCDSLPGTLGQLSVLLGLLTGAALAWAMGAMHLDGVLDGPVVSIPTPFPFGWPKFDLIAALPLHDFQRDLDG